MRIPNIVRKPPVLFLLPILMLASGDIHASSLLRVNCDDADNGAEIYVNGVFKGECPLDLKVNAGMLKLRLLKKIDAKREQVFEQEIRMGDDVVKKVEAKLSEPRLNADAQKTEDQRLAVERIKDQKREAARQQQLAEERRADAAKLAEERAAAEAGDAVAMLAIGDRYRYGKGVDQNSGTAADWYRKAAKAGSALAAFKASDVYRTSSQRLVDDITRILSSPEEVPRAVNVSGTANVKALIENDPFFDVPNGSGSLSYAFSPVNTVQSNVTCTATSGRLVRMNHRTEGPNIDFKGEGMAALGGLIYFQLKENRGFLRNSDYSIVEISSLSGQPFPLKVGKTFAATYKFNDDASQTLRCAVVADAPPTLACMQTVASVPSYHLLMRFIWKESTGCFSKQSHETLLY